MEQKGTRGEAVWRTRTYSLTYKIIVALVLQDEFLAELSFLTDVKQLFSGC